MTAEELAEVLEDLLRSVADDDDGDVGEFRGARLASFASSGLLTGAPGVVITLVDGSEFQVTVVQSRSRRLDEDDETGHDV